MQGQRTRAPPSFRKVIQLIARAFYSGECPPPDPDEPPRKKPLDVTGLGVVVLDALTRREWVKEDALAAELKLNAKALRRALQYLQQEQLVAREHRREAARGRKRASGGADNPAANGVTGSNTSDGPASAIGNEAAALAGDAVAENDDVGRGYVHSYCCLDYPRALDVAALRLHRLRRRLREQVQDRSPVMEYECSVARGGCGARFNSLQAAELIGADFNFHCEHCGGILDALLDGGGGGDEKERKSRLQAMKQLQADAEAQLKPLVAELETVRARLAQGAAAPDFGTLAEWAQDLTARIALGKAQDLQDTQRRTERGGAGAAGADGSGLESDRVPSVEVDLAGPMPDAAMATAASAAPVPKELPPWLRAQALSAGQAAAPAVLAGAGVGGPDAPLPDVQAAYVQAYLEQVRQRERKPAQDMRPAAAPSAKRAKTEHATAPSPLDAAPSIPGWPAAAAPVKAEADAAISSLQVAIKAEPATEGKAEVGAGAEEVEWEAAEPAGGNALVAAARDHGEASGSDVDWEDA